MSYIKPKLQCSMHISLDSFDCTPVDSGRGMEILTYLVYNKGNVRPCQGKILHSSQKTSVLCESSSPSLTPLVALSLSTPDIGVLTGLH
jgi:hypothetical protein